MIDPTQNVIMSYCHIVIVASIIAHSSTDVLIARWFRQTEEEAV
jgi:hypothetical protein